MVRRRAANVVGDTSDVNTGSSLYSRIGTTHMSMPCLRMSARQHGRHALREPALLPRRLLAQRAERAGRRAAGAVREADGASGAKRIASGLGGLAEGRFRSRMGSEPRSVDPTRAECVETVKWGLTPIALGDLVVHGAAVCTRCSRRSSR